MHRTQIYLEDAQYEALRARARREGRTLAAVLRDLVDQGLAPASSGSEPDPLDAIIGSARGDGSAVAENCDDYLYGEAGKKPAPTAAVKAPRRSPAGKRR